MYCSRESPANRMSDAPSSRASRPDRLPAALAVLAALAWALWGRRLLGAAGVPFGFPLDDSWIHLQLARNLAAGEGLAYRAGEHVAASTAPLWTALLAPGAALGAPLAWARLAGVACLAASIEVTRRLGLRLGLGRGLARLAAAATALAAPLVWGALSGLEIPLFTLLSLLGIHLHLADRRTPGLPLSLPVLSLAVLARPEGWLLLGLAVADRVTSRSAPSTVAPGPVPGAAAPSTGSAPSDGAPGPVPAATAPPPDAPPTKGGATASAHGGGPWRSTLAGLGVGALALAPVCLFAWAVGGSPFPSTLAAKSSGWRLLPDPEALGAAWRVLWRAQPAAALLAVAGLLVLAATARQRRPALLPAAWVLALPAALAMIESPAGPLLGNFGRYLFPLVPVMVLLAALALQAAIDGMAGTERPARRRLAAGAAALALLVPALPGLAGGATRFARNVYDVEASDGAVARWLAPRLDPDAVLAVHDIGRIGYTLPNPLVDLAGILDAEVREALERGVAGGDWQRELLSVLARRRPDYLVVFPRYVPFVDAPGLSFRRLHEVELPGNITMGDDRLAVYSTPWTRRPLRAVGP